ncbi:hypothetical protein HID58_059406 [Brassica napus]|uniref:Uncharacterized protein n=1 Tax=Brassica napus TaxID=3708 RepID=A0ABQ7ZSU2_BRANA|nr:hypothetical protein HID58_059406 [Brassica napus]
MTRVDLNVFSSSAADTESDPSVTINGLKPLSFRHRDGSTLAKTLPKIGDRHFDYRIYGDTIISLTVSSSSTILKHSLETEGMVECNYDATSKITGGWILRGHLGVALRGKHDRL